MDYSETVTVTRAQLEQMLPSVQIWPTQVFSTWHKEGLTDATDWLFDLLRIAEAKPPSVDVCEVAAS